MAYPVTLVPGTTDRGDIGATILVLRTTTREIIGARPDFPVTSLVSQNSSRSRQRNGMVWSQIVITFARWQQ